VSWKGVKTALSWLLAVLLSVSFVFSGAMKLPLDDRTVRRFEQWGYNAEFAVLIGVLEVLAGLFILYPPTVPLAAPTIVVLMLGAVWTHVSSNIGSPWFAAAYVVMAIGLLALRWNETQRYLATGARSK